MQQRYEDAFTVRGSIIEAALALGKMIARFDLQIRSGMHGGGYEDDPAEMRIFSVYATFDSLRSGEKIPPPPISLKPALVAADSNQC